MIRTRANVKVTGRRSLDYGKKGIWIKRALRVSTLAGLYTEHGSGLRSQTNVIPTCGSCSAEAGRLQFASVKFVAHSVGHLN